MTMLFAFVALQAMAGSSVPPGPPVPSVLSGTIATPPAVASPASRPSVSAGVATTPKTAVAPVATSRENVVPPSAAPRPARAQVLAAVQAEWPRYDTRRAGRLGPLEFSTWVMRANGASVAPAGVTGARGIKPISAMNVTARAFARADANHDGGVTPDEMADFLMR